MTHIKRQNEEVIRVGDVYCSIDSKNYHNLSLVLAVESYARYVLNENSSYQDMGRMAFDCFLTVGMSYKTINLAYDLSKTLIEHVIYNSKAFWISVAGALILPPAYVAYDITLTEIVYAMEFGIAGRVADIFRNFEGIPEYVAFTGGFSQDIYDFIL